MNIIRTFARKYELEIIVRKSGHQWKYGSEDSIIPCSQYLRNHWGGVRHIFSCCMEFRSMEY